MLEHERTYFDAHRNELLAKHAGRFVLIKGEELVGVFNTVKEALIEGVRRYGLDSFLVREVLETDPLISIPALTLGILRADSTQPA